MGNSSKHTHFIPSPFPTVTQYENQFVKEWRENNAAALGDVLKYIADVTAITVKELKNGNEEAMNDGIEKARRKHYEGEVDPNDPRKVWRTGRSGRGRFVLAQKAPAKREYYDNGEIIKNILQLRRGNKVVVKLGSLGGGFNYVLGIVNKAPKDSNDDVIISLSGKKMNFEPASAWRIRRITKTVEGQVDPSEAGKVLAADGPEARILDDDEE